MAFPVIPISGLAARRRVIVADSRRSRPHHEQRRVFRYGALQILRLESFSRKSAVGGVVISEGAAHAIVTTSAGQQGVDFLGGTRASPYPTGVEVKGTGTTAYAWYVWDKDAPSLTELRWLKPGYRAQYSQAVTLRASRRPPEMRSDGRHTGSDADLLQQTPRASEPA